MPSTDGRTDLDLVVTEGEITNGPYRDARPQDPIRDATNAVAHRLRMAAHGPWDGERCDAEAAEYVAQLVAHGWRPPPPPQPPQTQTWRHRRDPETNQRGVQAARAALAQARTEQP